jgi:hypothetical protein
MPDQRSEAPLPSSPTEYERHLESVVLGLLLTDHWPWGLDEIARELGDNVAATDTVARLAAAGLIHRSDNLVFPTRTARRAACIEFPGT